MSHRDDFEGVHGLEQELRRLAPEPGFEFFHVLEHSLVAPPERVRARPALGLRLGLAGALTVSLAAGLGATGGLSYAAASFENAARIVHRVARPETAVVVRGLSSGSDQYRPGFGFGDPNHNHTGPPGLTRNPPPGQPAAAPLPARPVGPLAAVVGASVTFDEQVHLYLSVIDPKGKPLLLTQRSKRGGSKVGGSKLGGPQTKFIQYAVLVPRTIPISLRVPSNLLRKGVVYRIRIVAIDPDGNKTRLLIPFRQAR